MIGSISNTVIADDVKILTAAFEMRFDEYVALGSDVPELRVLHDKMSCK